MPEVEVKELRVHGVGGTPAEGLLGVQGASDLVHAGGDSTAPFQARRKDSVEGYVWGRLTSNSLLQPLWLLLLPFTLVNVAGWMHPPERERRGPWALPVFRTVLQILGLAFTATYVVWMCNVSINRMIGVQSTFGLHPPRAVRMWIGSALVLAIIIAVLVTARLVQAGFESYPGPGATKDPAESLARPSLLQIALEFVQFVVFPIRGAVDTWRSVTRKDDLSSRTFWMRERESQSLLYLHIWVALATLVFVMFLAFDRVNFVPQDVRDVVARSSTRAYLGLGALAVGWTEALLWGLVALGTVQLLGWRRSDQPRFRFLGPMTTATLGVGLGIGFLYGLTDLIMKKPAGLEQLGTPFGLAILAWVIGIPILLVVLRAKKKIERRKVETPGQQGWIRPNSAGFGQQLNGATRSMYNNIAWARAMSDPAKGADLLLSLVQLVFIATALIPTLLGVRLDRVPTMASIASLGRWVAFTASVAVLVFLVRRSYRPNQRRLVGMLWDVLTFWPRRFHPLGVRPYAERAVPELQARLLDHTGKGRMVILSAHSQGSVLAYAALKQPDHLKDEMTGRIALVTYGSPLSQLHAYAFPAYFDRHEFDRLRGRLFGGATKNSPAWRNFYRLTDPIGKQVLGGDLEVEIPDPADLPPAADILLDPWPDPPRTPWVALARHSFYNNEAALKTWLSRLRENMKNAG